MVVRPTTVDRAAAPTDRAWAGFSPLVMVLESFGAFFLTKSSRWSRRSSRPIEPRPCSAWFTRCGSWLAKWVTPLTSGAVKR